MYYNNKFKVFANANLKFIYVFDEEFEIFKIPELWACYLFLEDSYFKQNHVTRFEAVLRSYYHAYYFNEKSGLHYDQFEVFQNDKRCILSCPYELALKEVKLQKSIFSTFPFHARSCDLSGLDGDFLCYSFASQSNFVENRFFDKAYN